MHETHLLKNIFRYLDEKEKTSFKKIKKVYFSLSELGGISPEHFKEHFKKEAHATKWENLSFQIKKIPYGAELEITRIEFEKKIASSSKCKLRTPRNDTI